MSPLPSVPLDRPVRELVGTRAAVAAIGIDGKPTLVYVQLSKARPGRVRATISDTATRTPMPPLVGVSVAGDLTLREVVLAHADATATNAGAVTKLGWPLSAEPSARNLPWLLLLIPIGLALEWQSLIPLLIGLFGVVAVGASRLGKKKGAGGAGPAVAFDELGGSLRPSQVSAMLPPPELAPGAQPSPRERVGAVRDAFAQLQGDIAYRIENSALFDSQFGPTEAFEVALLRFDEASPDAHGLALEVESTFAEAREAAERLGFDHLPETARGTARRAQLAVATALGAASEPEQRAARKKVADLLGSLALYYLPTIDPDAPELIARRRPIEPRR